MATEITPTTNFGLSQLVDHTPPAIKSIIYTVCGLATLYGMIVLASPTLIPENVQHWANMITPVVVLVGNMFGVKKDDSKPA